MEGTLLKMKKSITGGTYWKSHWISSDGIRLQQFNSDKRPKKEVTSLNFE
jgi:hypothetical protein